MSRLFLIRRPGILVVCGTVTEVKGDGLVIENNYPFPVSGPQPARVHMQADEKKLANLRLKNGAFIIASTTDAFEVEMLLDGGETANRDYNLTAYNIRYNGSFDFDERGLQKESHVILGSCVSAQLGKSKNGQQLLVCHISWQQLGLSRVAKVCLFGDTVKPENILKKRVAAITGPVKQTERGTIYIAKELILCD